MPEHSYYRYQKPLLSSLGLVFRVIWSGIATAVAIDNLSTELGNNSSTHTPSDTGATPTTNNNKERPL
jgi:hypothetical protein